MNRKYQTCALAIAVILSAHAFAHDSGREYGPWDNPVPAPGINTAAAEGCPIESPNGRHLYFMSTRNGGLDIWRATWDGLMRSWDNVTNLGAPVNSPPPPTTARRRCPAGGCCSSARGRTPRIASGARRCQRRRRAARRPATCS